jgi:hypothetical protein
VERIYDKEEGGRIGVKKRVGKLDLDASSKPNQGDVMSQLIQSTTQHS